MRREGSTRSGINREAAARTTIFERIVCGVDGSPEGVEALRQATRLVAPGGRLIAATVHDPGAAVYGGWAAGAIAVELERRAAEVQAQSERALAGLPNAEARLLSGPPARRLLDLAWDEDATLLVVGSHGRSRAAGIVLGSVATMLVHDAPVSVLVARAPAEADAFPRALVVGLDGSAESLAAAGVARKLAERFGTAVRAIAATGGKPIDVDGLVALTSAGSSLKSDEGRIPTLEWREEPPVEALLAASVGADLILVGSRGLHGVAALGSVGERVAHRAGCSVLVVRGREHPSGPA